MGKAQTIDRLELTRRKFAKQLGLEDEAQEEKQQEAPKEEHYGVSTCPNCEQLTLIHEGGCDRCPNCGLEFLRIMEGMIFGFGLKLGGEKTMRLIRNRIKCNHCGDIIESKFTHDFKRCKCGAVAVEGGLDYTKRVYKSNDPEEDYTELSEWAVKNDNEA